MNLDEKLDDLLTLAGALLPEAQLILIVSTRVPGTEVAALRIGSLSDPETVRQMLSIAAVATRATHERATPPVRTPKLEPELKPKEGL